MLKMLRVAMGELALRQCRKGSRIKVGWRLEYETPYGMRYGYSLYGILHDCCLEVAHRRQRRAGIEALRKKAKTKVRIRPANGD